MRVAYITMQFPVPSETFACNDVRTLRKMGMEVSVHGLRTVHPDAEKLLEERNLDGLELSHADASTLSRGLTYGALHPLLLIDLIVWILRSNWKNSEHLAKSLLLIPRVLEIFAQLERKSVDVVHLYWGHYPSLVGYLVQRYLPETVVSMALAVYDLDMAYGGSKYVAQHADVVKTLARVNLPRIEELVGLKPDRVEVMYDSLDIAGMGHLVETKEAKVPRRVVTAGRLHPGKGIDDALEVFARVLKDHPDATLHILGDGRERQSLEEKCRRLAIEHAVTFKGHVDHKTVFEEMAKAEAFLFLSKAERLPNVVKEAMLSRCVCITTDTIGIREMIPNDDYGFVVPIGAIDEASEHLKYAFDHPEAMTALLGRARQHILEHFDIDKAMRAHIEAWSQAKQRRITALESPVGARHA